MKKIWLYMLTAFAAVALSGMAYADTVTTGEGEKIEIGAGHFADDDGIANADFEFQPSPSVSMSVNAERHYFALTAMSVSAKVPQGMVYGIFSDTQGYYQRAKTDEDDEAPSGEVGDLDGEGDVFEDEDEWTYMGGSSS
ncbi:hypothetical protein LZ24_00005 [Desulfobotulus alkaliphilus]|uniref:Uncharacterized protein n=1 Tax=Desulfobotulus alkaliphilus TaxID=622671 RepID=A0A562S733_9BACT|nr:hypothetical protein [Desulfobotulus alkaliphilus]TWI77205.1 hypothetical protein LZ24_00005 [Desulfobotulus alkaliphilus]